MIDRDIAIQGHKVARSPRFQRLMNITFWPLMAIVGVGFVLWLVQAIMSALGLWPAIYLSIATIVLAPAIEYVWNGEGKCYSKLIGAVGLIAVIWVLYVAALFVYDPAGVMGQRLIHQEWLESKRLLFLED